MSFGFFFVFFFISFSFFFFATALPIWICQKKRCVKLNVLFRIFVNVKVVMRSDLYSTHHVILQPWWWVSNIFSGFEISLFIIIPRLCIQIVNLFCISGRTGWRAWPAGGRAGQQQGMKSRPSISRHDKFCMTEISLSKDYKRLSTANPVSMTDHYTYLCFVKLTMSALSNHLPHLSNK